MTEMSLDALNDDILLHVLSFLSVPDILSVRQTCRLLSSITRQWAVWVNAYNADVLHAGFPFAAMPPNSNDVIELERRTRAAYRLGKKMLSSSSKACRAATYDAHTSVVISDIRFVPGHKGNWLLTISKGIWSVIILWTVSDGLKRLCEWGPKGTLFNIFTLNTESNSPATVAVSVLLDGSSKVEVLGIFLEDNSCTPEFRSCASLETRLKPIALGGNLVALAEKNEETVIWNWRDNTFALLRHDVESGTWQDRSVGVIFTSGSVIVFLSRAVFTFNLLVFSPSIPASAQVPIAKFSFGYVDGISVSPGPRSLFEGISHSSEYQPISTLVRSRVDDPWVFHPYMLQLYVFELDPMYKAAEETPPIESDSASRLPYIIPPRLVSEIDSAYHHPFRCGTFVLGRCGTAVWISPSVRTDAMGLISEEIFAQQLSRPSMLDETLKLGIFPGALKPHSTQVEIHSLTSNMLNDWTCLDYDEDVGRVALGSSSGSITILDI